MEDRMEKNVWMSVPQFGGWDNGSTDYSVVFNRARENRKQHKSDISRVSIGNEKDFMAAYNHDNRDNHDNHDDPIMRKKRILTYINCCIRP